MIKLKFHDIKGILLIIITTFILRKYGFEVFGFITPVIEYVILIVIVYVFWLSSILNIADKKYDNNNK